MEYFRALLAVLSDLLSFFGGRTSPSMLLETHSVTTTPPITQPVVVPVPAAADTSTPTSLLLNEATDQNLGETGLAWVIIQGARLYSRPVAALDTVLARVPYSTAVMPQRHEGRFTQVRWGDYFGWINKNALVYDEAAVFPVLMSGTVYDAHHSATVLIRRYSDDAFAADDLLVPLLGAEYVTYALARAGRNIPWPKMVRPRLAGDWHRLLRGVRGVQIGITPRTGAVYEYSGEKGAYLGLVEAVHPNGKLVRAGIGEDREGLFVREEVTPEQYREEGGVFIMVA